MATEKKYKLSYFDLRGRGEVPRMIFNYLGVEFEDKRIPFPEWPAAKSTFPLGFIPVITTPDGTDISQTLACIMYMGDEFSLYGNNASQRGVINCVVISMKEIHDHCADITVFLKEEEEKEKVRTTLDKKIPIFFKYFEELRSQNNSSAFLVSESITIADFFLVDTLEFISAAMPGRDFLADYPKLKALNDHVRGLDKVKEYLATRK